MNNLIELDSDAMVVDLPQCLNQSRRCICSKWFRPQMGTEGVICMLPPNSLKRAPVGPHSFFKSSKYNKGCDEMVDCPSGVTHIAPGYPNHIWKAQRLALRHTTSRLWKRPALQTFSSMQITKLWKLVSGWSLCFWLLLPYSCGPKTPFWGICQQLPRWLLSAILTSDHNHQMGPSHNLRSSNVRLWDNKPDGQQDI